MEFAAFKRILAPYKEALAKRGVALNITVDKVKDRLSARASEIRDKIRNEVKKKPLCLLIDIGSRYNRSVFGVSISFLANKKVVFRSIAMHVLRVEHTSANLVEIITNKLNEYGISLDQILSVTSDNGKNMIKSIALLNELLNADGVDEFGEEENDVDNAEGQSEDEDEDDDGETGLDIFDNDYYRDLLTNVRSEFANNMYSDLVHGVSCAAHCLHLIIIAGILACSEYVALFDKCRNLSKTLRTSKYRNLFKEAHLLQAKIDQDTRWNSRYEMVI